MACTDVSRADGEKFYCVKSLLTVAVVLSLLLRCNTAHRYAHTTAHTRQTSHFA